MYQFWQIHVTTERNPCKNSDKFTKSNITTSIDGLNDKARQESNLGPIKILPLVTYILKDKRKILIFGWL